jgi:hypothetical protein
MFILGKVTQELYCVLTLIVAPKYTPDDDSLLGWNMLGYTK